MVWIKRISLAILVALLLAVTGIYATGNGSMLKLIADFTFGAPELPFDPTDAVAPPDYQLEENWAALPDRDDLADLTPEGIDSGVKQGSAPVDVFFIHPTGFLKGSSWTFNMNPRTSTEENTKWMIANQASAYNGCCNVYAPRYRQASIFTYFATDDSTREEVLGFAYQDVERAFDYFLEHYNEGRPFVLASHSQGTHHGIRLLRDRIDGTELSKRLVAAYIIGGGLEQEEFQALKDISVCNSAKQLTCAITWDTFSVATVEDNEDSNQVCVNPLNWKRDGGLAEKYLHRGAVRGSGEYHLELSGDDAERGVQFAPMGAPQKHLVEAECIGGRLYITDQSDTPFGERGSFAGTYHGLDYPIFYMDIRDNAQLRVRMFLAQAEAAAA